ncbi:hypothetical protein [Falsigemmobacter faecalis]|uniref:Uncharacterized protein n=1 Tax=Falsigemmobacter faecalis TaxID=2488730 RepID=A0A3P3DQD6_9RHOB|nr:hypothetical protein [Falsigemmobacter faecalis]RRH76154.1 hypothetical protein EG244_06965 [Falsigemmobacter faecalis]
MAGDKIRPTDDQPRAAQQAAALQPGRAAVPEQAASRSGGDGFVASITAATIGLGLAMQSRAEAAPAPEDGQPAEGLTDGAQTPLAAEGTPEPAHPESDPQAIEIAQLSEAVALNDPGSTAGVSPPVVPVETPVAPPPSAYFAPAKPLRETSGAGDAPVQIASNITLPESDSPLISALPRPGAGGMDSASPQPPLAGGILTPVTGAVTAVLAPVGGLVGDLLGRDGVVGSIVNPILGPDGLVGNLLDPLLGESGLLTGVLDGLLGSDGLLGGLTEPLLGEGGLVGGLIGGLTGGVLNPLLGEGGVIGSITAPLLGEGGLLPGLLAPLSGAGGLVGTVTGAFGDGLISPLLGEGGLSETLLSPLLGDNGIIGGLLSPLLGGGGLLAGLLSPPGGETSVTAGLADSLSEGILTPVFGENGAPGQVGAPLVGADGLVSGLLGTLIGEGGLTTQILSPLQGAGGLSEAVLAPLPGNDGLLGGLLSPLTGTGGTLADVVTPLIGPEGPLTSVVGTVQAGVLQPLLGPDGVAGTLLGPIVGDEGALRYVLEPLVGEDGLLDQLSTPLIGENGLLPTLLDPLLDENGLLSGLLNPLVGGGGILDVTLTPVLNSLGPVGHVVDSLLGGLFGGWRNRGSSQQEAIPVQDAETLYPDENSDADDFLSTLIGDAASDMLPGDHDALADLLGAPDAAFFAELFNGTDGIADRAETGGEDLLSELLGLTLTGTLAAPGLLEPAVPAETRPDAELDDLLNEILDSGERALAGVADPLSAILEDVAGGSAADLGDLFGLAPSVDGALRTLFGAADAEVEVYSALADAALQPDLQSEEQQG